MKYASLIRGALAGCVLSILGTPGAIHAQVPGGADSVKVQAHAEPATLRPGEPLSIVVVLDHAAGFHTWPHEPVVPPEFEGLIPIATSIEASALPEGAAVDDIRWPEPATVMVQYTREPVKLLAYAGDAVARVVVRLTEDMPAGEHSIELRVRYQACDERICYPPKTVKVSVPFSLGPGSDGRLRGR